MPSDARPASSATAKKISAIRVRRRPSRLDDALRPPAIRTYDMKGDPFRTHDVINGVVSLGAVRPRHRRDNTWADGALGDAHVYSGFTYDYYFKRFNRRGLNDANLRMQTPGAPGAPRATSRCSTAIFSDLLHQRRLLRRWPDGLRRRPAAGVTSSGRSWNYTSGALDIVAHEITHGVTEFTSDLIYLNESGALNESFSDIMGTAVEFFFQPAGDGLLRADYLCGEDVVARDHGRHPLAGEPDAYWPSRSLFGPLHRDGGRRWRAHELGHLQPRVLPRDRGGHQPGVGPRASQGVGAANRVQIETVFYRAFTQLLPANATFAMARRPRSRRRGISTAAAAPPNAR